MKRLWLGFVLLSSPLLSLSLGGCSSSQASNVAPAVLHYAYSPQSEQLQGGGLRKELMRNYLQSQLHIPVEVVSVEGYAPTIEAMRAEKVDIASFGSLAYIIASQKAGAQAIVSRGNPDGSLGGYRSAIAVPRNSPIHSLEDLKAHAKDLVFAFADPASTSGNLYPRVGLLAMGIDPEKNFKQVVFANGHLACVMAVKAGKVDAGGFAAKTVDRLVEKGKMKPDDVRVLWTSDLIPDGPYAVRKGLPEPLKKEIQAALLAIPTKDPELWANLTSLYRTFSTATQLIPVKDATYDGLRKYAAQVKDFNFVEK